MTRRTGWAVFCVLSTIGQAPPALSDSVTLGASTDNMLVESAAGDLSNGAGGALAAGRTGQAVGSIRRGLIAFDLTGQVPGGSTITSVELTLYLSRSATDSAYDVALYRALAAWGEGTSNSDGTGGHGGGIIGAPAAPGDATWLHRFYPTVFWQTPGGDFAGAASATTSVGIDASYGWGATSELVADVQAWVANPAANFGWVIVGNESTVVTAKAFHTHEYATAEERPALTIGFTPPAPCVGDLDGNRSVDLSDLAVLLAHFGATCA